MPQMMPMNWTNIYILNILIFLIILFSSFHSVNLIPPKNNIKYMMKKKPFMIQY